MTIREFLKIVTENSGVNLDSTMYIKTHDKNGFTLYLDFDEIEIDEMLEEITLYDTSEFKN